MSKVAALQIDEKTAAPSRLAVCARPALESRAVVEESLEARRHRKPRLPLLLTARAVCRRRRVARGLPPAMDSLAGRVPQRSQTNDSIDQIGGGEGRPQACARAAGQLDHCPDRIGRGGMRRARKRAKELECRPRLSRFTLLMAISKKIQSLCRADRCSQSPGSWLLRRSSSPTTTSCS